ncbi:hypothetical protein [Pseudooceanicola algae]|uniref:Uncharacterized protein n=1 Tax=Pseudooceanicola algae TaxID=1537215 RepID=A0A418SL76_9RHOB|nr:hypothetical protein [Pseudooceanicola algae]QPM90830.1 hypothetical protein PSAL_020720 [Pseudooceanicola algae]
MSDQNPKNLLRKITAWIAGLIVVSFCIAVIWGSWTRTFLVEARTFGAILALRGDTNTWELENAVLCEAKAPDPTAKPNEYCPSVIFTVSESGPRILDWPPGAVVSVRLRPDNSLQVEAISGAAPVLDDGDRLVIPSETWMRHGVLAVNGAIIFGGNIASGARDYLLSGHWEARQESLASSLFRPTMETVKQGKLSRGASIEIWRSGWLWGQRGKAVQATVFGHITPSFNQDEPGLIISVLSEAARLELHLAYYGLENPAVIRPDMLDTIMTSPVILAAAAILGVLVLALDLGNGLQGGSQTSSPKLSVIKRLRLRPPKR